MCKRCSLCSLEQLEPLSNPNIAQIHHACTGIGVNGVAALIVAALIEASEIEPDFRDIIIRVYSDRMRISVKGVMELVDLEVEKGN